MNTKQIKLFFEGKEYSECPLTEKLVKAGYQQEKGGYIKYAHDCGIEVDFNRNLPSQWWHLITAYCKDTDDEKQFTKRIQCGELLFWMAEVSDSVDKTKLENLVNDIISSGEKTKNNNGSYTFKRDVWNREIQKICFDEIVRTVESE